MKMKKENGEGVLPDTFAEEQQHEKELSLATVRQKKKIERIEKDEHEINDEMERSIQKAHRRIPRKPRVEPAAIEKLAEEIKSAQRSDPRFEPILPQERLWQKRVAEKAPPVPQRKPWWKKILGFRFNEQSKKSIALKVAMAPLAAGASLGGPSKSEAKIPEDSLRQKTEKVWNMDKNPNDSLSMEKLPYDEKKLEKAGVVRINPVETKDTTKQVFLISLESYKNYGDVFKALKKAGFEPASNETLQEVVDMNEDIAKKSRAIISLKQILNKLGNPSYGTMTWDDRTNHFISEAIEIDKDFDSNYEQYRFVVEMPKKTVSYESGIVKK